MNVKSARGTDYVKLLALIMEAHARSNIAAYPFDPRYCQEFCLTLMMANTRRPVHDSAHIYVAEADDKTLHGFVIPAAQRLYIFGHDLIVSDLMFYTKLGADARAAGMLWDAVEKWASVPEVVSIRPGVTNAIGDPERTALFFEARGYERMGYLLEKRRASVATRKVA